MWIKIQNKSTKKIKIPAIDEPVEFNENGVARVEKDVGETLIEENSLIEERQSEEEEQEDDGEDSYSVERQDDSEEESSE